MYTTEDLKIVVVSEESNKTNMNNEGEKENIERTNLKRALNPLNTDIPLDSENIGEATKGMKN